jgi:hypothetical protein
MFISYSLFVGLEKLIGNKEILKLKEIKSFIVENNKEIE